MRWEMVDGKVRIKEEGEAEITLRREEEVVDEVVEEEEADEDMDITTEADMDKEDTRRPHLSLVSYACLILYIYSDIGCQIGLVVVCLCSV